MKSRKYGIDFVISVNRTALDDLNLKKTANKTEMTCNCWVCGGNEKVGINLEKGVYNCVRCANNSGNMTDLHIALQKYGNDRDLDRTAAEAELDKIFDSLSDEQKKNYMDSLEAIISTPKYASVLPIEKRDKIYSRQIELLTLSDIDYCELKNRRKIPDSVITDKGYRTTPVMCEEYIGEKAVLTSGAVRCENDGDPSPYYYHWFKDRSPLPGYYTLPDGHIAMVSRRPAIMIPVRWRHGEVSLFQLRYRDPPKDTAGEQLKGFRKYAWFTSGDKETGCQITGCEAIHHTFSVDKQNEITPKEVAITEGPLKADIANCYWPMPFIAVAGINNLCQLPEEFTWLKEHGTEVIKVCIDKDWLINPNVCKGTIDIIQMVLDANMEVDFCVWNEDRKGIDDLLVDYGPDAIICKHINSDIWATTAKPWFTDIWQNVKAKQKAKKQEKES